MADNDYNYDRNDRGSGGNNNNNNGKSPWPMIIAIILGGALLIFVASRMFSNVGSFFSEEITYNEFLKYLNEDRVERVVLQDGSQWQIKLRNDNKTYLTQYMPDEDIVPLLKEKGVTFSASTSSNILSYVLIYIVPMLIMVLLFVFLMRRMGGSGGIMGMPASGGWRTFTMPQLLSPTMPMAMPATCFFIGTPAAISERLPPQMDACELEPFDSMMSETTRTT